MKKVLLFVLVFVLGYVANSIIPSNILGSPEVNVLTGAATIGNSALVLTSTSTQVVAANTGRTYLWVQNSGPSVVDCAFGTPAIALKGIRLGTSTPMEYEVKSDNLFLSSFNCIASSATGTVQYLEK